MWGSLLHLVAMSIHLLPLLGLCCGIFGCTFHLYTRADPQIFFSSIQLKMFLSSSSIFNKPQLCFIMPEDCTITHEWRLLLIIFHQQIILRNVCFNLDSTINTNTLGVKTKFLFIGNFLLFCVCGATLYIKGCWGELYCYRTFFHSPLI